VELAAGGAVVGASLKACAKTLDEEVFGRREGVNDFRCVQKSPIMAPMPARYAGPATTLGNMRSNGVRSIAAGCECGRKAIIDVSSLPGTVEVLSLRKRLRCSAFGSRPNDVRPNWLEYVRLGMGQRVDVT
jgi:hypothetical protein